MTVATSDGACEAIHPYFGWVHNPQVSKAEEIFGKEIPVNRLGFQDDNESIQKRSSDRFILGIVGGSVAWQTSVAGSEIIKARLGSHPAIHGRRVEIVRLATSGYKQPQQVMALNFVQVLGGEFDAVVNIDGYNEVALALAENGRLGTAISYPRSWHTRVISALNPESYAAAARLLQLRGSRQQAAKDLLGSKFRWSPFRNLVWLASEQTKLAETIDLGMEVSRNRTDSFVNHGPQDGLSDESQMENSAIDLWRRSSVQLQRLCHASDTVYLHVLQPNQYVAGSKVLSDQEKNDYFDPNGELGDVIKEIYPRLVAESAWLKTAGVAFSDQTMLFVDIAETIYCDPFCHYNQRGNEMLATAVAEEPARLIPTSTAP